MTSIENPAFAAMAKAGETKKAEKPADLEKAKKLEQEVAKTTQGRRLEDLEADELKKVLAKYQEIERVLGIAEEESASSLSAVWKNPETGQEQAVEIDLEKELAEQGKFYKDKLNLDIDAAEIRNIWRKNYAEIKSEIEKYGYDSILVVPDDLPGEEILNQSLIETMEETVGGKKQKVAATYQSDNFKSGGSFGGTRNSYPAKYRIVLSHSAQNIYNNPAANPFLKATLGKNITQLSVIAPEKIDEMIKNNREIPIDFKADINGQEIQIQAEGESLEEYILQQAMYFAKTGKHLDENGWTWLTKSRSGSRVVSSSWYPDARQLFVRAFDPVNSAGALGLRLSRSFSS